MKRRQIFVAATCTLLAGACPQLATADGSFEDPEYRIVRPSNTGIPGHNDMLFVTFGPDGRLWTHGRNAFWQQGGVAALDFATTLWKTYSSAETPLDQFCYDMTFADDGSAWIACEDVIARLHADGETFTAYTASSTGVLATGDYGQISVAADGHVWASNWGSVGVGGGLFEFDGTQWIRHQEPWMVAWTGFGPAPALNVLARSNGDVWSRLDTLPASMGLYRDGQWTQITTGPFILDMAETADGTMYGVDAFGAYRMNDDTGEWEQIGTFGSPSIALDPTSDALYIRSDLYSVMRYNGSSWSHFATFPGWVGGMTVGPDGDVWIAAETWLSHYELHRYSADGQLLRVYTRSNTGMLDYFPPGMYLDHDGYMWFTDSEYGASRLEPDENWRNFGIYNGGEEVYPFWVSPVAFPFWSTPGYDFWTESVDQVFHDSQGNIWLRGPNIIARSHGDDLSEWDIWPPGQSGFPWQCSSMGEDAEGNFWVGTSFVAYRLDSSSWTEVPIGIPGQFADVHGWTVAPDGSLWVAKVGTFYRFIDGAFEPVLELPTNILQFKFAPDGTLWVGTVEGLYHWDGNDFTVYTPENSGMAETAVVSLDIRPEDGLVAVATGQTWSLPYHGGVALFDGEAWTSYDYGSSFLPFYAIGDMQFDADGHLWIGVLNFGAVQVFIGGNDPTTPGDIDGDGVVGFSDLLWVMSAWGECPAPPADCPADLDGNGSVDFADLLTVLSFWTA